MKPVTVSAFERSDPPVHVLIDIVHPADVLFFLRPIRMLQARGDRVTVVSRQKDVATDLLDGFGVSHRVISKQGSGVVSLARELLHRDWSLWRIVRRDKPDVMLGFGGVAISHVGRLTGVPSVAFYDSETATLQNRITFPFVTQLVVPESYDGPVPEKRTMRLPGTKDLSYFHPNAFKPDRARALDAGLDPDGPNVFVRIVKWGANHDIGKSGWSVEIANRLVDTFKEKARLHVSAEEDVPDVLKPFLWTGQPEDVHHLLGHSDVYLGESATMACEAATMGTPAIYAGHDFLGYTRGLERAGLLHNVMPEDRNTLPELAKSLLNNRDAFDTARAHWLAACPDWAESIVDIADRFATSD
jgi:predicted glycosyltransferase